METVFLNQRLAGLASLPGALVVHPHAQRTGGGTFRNRVLAAGFGKEHVYSRMFRGEFKPWAKITDADLNGYRAYTDLSNYCDLPLSRQCLPVALLRDPLYRAVSLYHFVRKMPDHAFYELAMTCSLEAFYGAGASTNPRYFRNVQTARICGVANAELALEYIMTKYLAVGFTERLDVLAASLSGIFGWTNVQVEQNPPKLDCYNAQITDRFREMVLSQNEEDRLLFEAMTRGPPYRISKGSIARGFLRSAKRRRDAVLALARGVQKRIRRPALTYLR